MSQSTLTPQEITQAFASKGIVATAHVNDDATRLVVTVQDSAGRPRVFAVNQSVIRFTLPRGGHRSYFPAGNPIVDADSLTSSVVDAMSAVFYESPVV